MKRNTLVLISLITLLALNISTVQASVVYNDGQVNEISTTISGYVSIFDSVAGDPTTVNIVTGGKMTTVFDEEGGFEGGVEVNNNSILNLVGGEIERGLVARDNSSVVISNGTMNSGFGAHDHSHVIITGGNIYTEPDDKSTSLRGNALVEIYGSNFMLYDHHGNGESVGYGEITADYAKLTGTLQNGDALSMWFWRSDDASIVLVPEPATLALLGLGALVLRKRKH